MSGKSFTFPVCFVTGTQGLRVLNAKLNMYTTVSEPNITRTKYYPKDQYNATRVSKRQKMSGVLILTNKFLSSIFLQMNHNLE